MARTPVFGIRTPDTQSKARDLGANLEVMASDVEAALLAAQIPPAVPANIYTAPTAAARNLRFGSPTTAAARLALQNLGAMCIRTDLGYTEQYLAGTTDGGSNPGGAATAGWYPVTGTVPFGFARRAGIPRTLALDVWTSLTNSAWWTATAADKSPDFGAFTGQWMAPVAGWYDVSAQVFLVTQGTGLLTVNKNSTTDSDVGAVLRTGVASVGGQLSMQIAGQVKLAAGDRLGLKAFVTPAAATWSVATDDSYLSVKFAKPAR